MFLKKRRLTFFLTLLKASDNTLAGLYFIPFLNKNFCIQGQEKVHSGAEFDYAALLPRPDYKARLCIIYYPACKSAGMLLEEH